MDSLKGDISVIPVTDILQWIDLFKKTGTLSIHSHGFEKKIFLEDGKIIYVSSNKEGERLGEFLQRCSYLSIEKVQLALTQSQAMKIRFTQRLIELNYFTKEQLTEIVTLYAKELLLDIISWKEGLFEFTQGFLPSCVKDALIKLNTSQILFEIFNQIYDLNIRSEGGYEKNIEWEI